MRVVACCQNLVPTASIRDDLSLLFSAGSIANGCACIWCSSICHAVASQDPLGGELPQPPPAAEGDQSKSEQSESTPPAIQLGGLLMPEEGAVSGAAQNAPPATTRKRVVRRSARGAETEKQGAIAVGRYTPSQLALTNKH